MAKPDETVKAKRVALKDPEDVEKAKKSAKGKLFIGPSKTSDAAIKCGKCGNVMSFTQPNIRLGDNTLECVACGAMNEVND
jgi:hypothetical protein